MTERGDDDGAELLYDLWKRVGDVKFYLVCAAERQTRWSAPYAQSCFRAKMSESGFQLLEIMEKSKYLADREGFKVYLKAQKEELAERNKKYVCCGQPMLFCGKHEFQKGSMDFFTGSLGNIMAGSMEMAVFQCEVCGQYKFYDPRVVERRQGQTVVCACGREYPRYMLRCPECGAEERRCVGGKWRRRRSA